MTATCRHDPTAQLEINVARTVLLRNIPDEEIKPALEVEETNRAPVEIIVGGINEEEKAAIYNLPKERQGTDPSDETDSRHDVPVVPKALEDDTTRSERQSKGNREH